MRCFEPIGLEEERPARTEAAQNIVEPGAGADQLGFRGALKVRSSKPEGPLDAAILVEHDAGCNERRPGQMIGEPIDMTPIFPNLQHERNPFCRR